MDFHLCSSTNIAQNRKWLFVCVGQEQETGGEGVNSGIVPIDSMPYDTHGGGHRGESRLYCPRTEMKFSEMTSGAQ